MTLRSGRVASISLALASASVVLASPAWAVAPAPVKACSARCDVDVGTTARSNGSKIIISQFLRESGGAGKPSRLISGSGGASKFVYRVTDDCSHSLCGQSFHRDEYTAANPSTHTRVVQAADVATPTKFGAASRTCVGKGVTVVDGAPVLGALAHLLDEVKPPPAVFHVEPGGGKTLVQIPTLMYADLQGPMDKPAVVQGVPVRVHSKITSWTWIVDGVATMTTDHPGGGYDGTNPLDAPGYYISHTFTMHGKHSIGLRTTWASTVTQADGSPLPLNRGTSVTSPVYGLTALQARARLESGTGDSRPFDPADPDGDAVIN